MTTNLEAMIATEFLRITPAPTANITGLWCVKNSGGNVMLGYIRWHAQWRRYVFVPSNDLIFDASCLHTITTFIIDRMNERKE